MRSMAEAQRRGESTKSRTYFDLIVVDGFMLHKKLLDIVVEHYSTAG